MSRAVAIACAAGVILVACERTQSSTDLVAQARSGALLCHSPSAVGKRCNTITKFEFSPDGKVRVFSETTMSKELVVRHSVEAEVRGKEICMRIRPQDADDASFIVFGRPATLTETLDLRKQIKSNMRRQPLREGCMALSERDGRVMMDPTLDGVAQPRLSAPVIWVREGDGYVVSPA